MIESFPFIQKSTQKATHGYFLKCKQTADFMRKCKLDMGHLPYQRMYANGYVGCLTQLPFSARLDG